jgi:hypothetical protein
MALSPAEKQRRYRDRLEGKLVPPVSRKRVLPPPIALDEESQVPAALLGGGDNMAVAQAAAAARLAGIDAETAAWMNAPMGPPRPADAPPIAELPSDAKATAEATVRRLEQQLDRLATLGTASARECASVASSLTSATRLLARLSGALDITKSQIERSPHWAGMMATIADALAPYPDAAAAVAKALRASEGGA